MKIDNTRKENDGFWSIPKHIAGRKISEGAKLCYSVLWTRRNGDNFAWPSQEYLALQMGCSVRTVRRHIRDLTREKLLKIHRRGLHKSNVYGLVVPDRTELSYLDRTELSYPIVREHSKKHNIMFFDEEPTISEEEATPSSKEWKKKQYRELSGRVPREQINEIVEFYKKEMVSFGIERPIVDQKGFYCVINFLKDYRVEDAKKLISYLLTDHKSPFNKGMVPTLSSLFSATGIHYWQL